MVLGVSQNMCTNMLKNHRFTLYETFVVEKRVHYSGDVACCVSLVRGHEVVDRFISTRVSDSMFFIGMGKFCFHGEGIQTTWEYNQE